MSEKTKSQQTDNEAEDYKIVFTKPYLFEGKEYDQIDLSGMEEFTTYQLIEAEKEFMQDNNFINILSETTTALGCIIASRITELPIDFYHKLPANEGNKIKQKVMGFFYQ